MQPKIVREWAARLREAAAALDKVAGIGSDASEETCALVVSETLRTVNNIGTSMRKALLRRFKDMPL